MSRQSAALVLDKKDLKRLISAKKGFTANNKNENKIESRFAKYPFGCLSVS